MWLVYFEKCISSNLYYRPSYFKQTWTSSLRLPIQETEVHTFKNLLTLTVNYIWFKINSVKINRLITGYVSIYERVNEFWETNLSLPHNLISYFPSSQITINESRSKELLITFKYNYERSCQLVWNWYLN